MKLNHLAFSEFEGAPNEWILEGFSLGDVTLVVGKNASGKSRLLNVINGLAKLMSGDLRTPFFSGSYDVGLCDAQGEFRYKLILEDQKVVKESLERGGQLLFERGADGVGRIWAEKAGLDFDFSVPNDVLVVNAKRDRVQHSYLELIYNWASTLRFYQFANTFGQGNHGSIPQLISLQERDELIFEVGKVHEVYSKGYGVFGDAFDQAILKDLRCLGYDCTDVGIEPLNLPQLKGLPLATLFVKEEALRVKTIQINMSQGMFRALALVIELNFIVFNGKALTVLVDDVGEGLDFDRSRAFISLLREKAASSDLQLVMTTNDRFVMNDTPLDNWGVVVRQGSRVKIVNSKNSPAAFEDFKLLGLNNFDFFADQFFEQVLE